MTRGNVEPQGAGGAWRAGAEPRLLARVRQDHASVPHDPGVGRCALAVIEGDQQTSADADASAPPGHRAIQIQHGKGCHLDAAMVGPCHRRPSPAAGVLPLHRECGEPCLPRGFDLGRGGQVAILSVTEGEDKPLKYPDMFHRGRLAILNKTDLAPHCDVDLDLTRPACAA